MKPFSFLLLLMKRSQKANIIELHSVRFASLLDATNHKKMGKMPKLWGCLLRGVARVEKREGQIIFKGAQPQEGTLKRGAECLKRGAICLNRGAK